MKKMVTLKILLSLFITFLFFVIYNEHTSLIIFYQWLALISVLLNFTINKYVNCNTKYLSKRRITQISFVLIYVISLLITQNGYYTTLILLYQIAFYEIIKSSKDESIQVSNFEDHSKILSILMTVLVYIACTTSILGLEKFFPYFPIIALTLAMLFDFERSAM
ncbi:hypothetical protein [Fusibacter sp. JL216-2]|uniref:hypothetical protein n=1 Tax=Fusibacter sp. JL216-2 TaxID=3071453 RepID=UPI003D33967D